MMRLLELKPTQENIMDSFKKDMIGRNSDVFMFADLLNVLNDNCSISLDGAWGSGKTFFVKQVKAFIDSQNEFVRSISNDDKVCIENIWKASHGNKELNYIPQVTVYYDAWENDNDQDPILSLVYSILKNVNDSFSIPSDSTFFDIAATILEFFTGKNWESIVKEFRSEDPLEGLRKTKAIEEHIKDFLNSLLEERGERLVVFIDELDRCKPSFAVQLLERIKHYFTNDRITFVFSINSLELQHTIKKHYGDGFDGCRYLDRFFDIPVLLPPANMGRFLSSVHFEDGAYYYDIMCKTVMAKYRLTLRECTRYIALSKIAAYKPTHENRNFNFHFPSGKAKFFTLIYVVPIMIGLRIVDIAEYNQFINGQNCKPLLDFKDCFGKDFFAAFFDKNEVYEQPVDGKKLITVEEKIEEIYNALFVTQYSGLIQSVTLGEYQFTEDTKNSLMRTVSLFSNYANHFSDF